jgi:hypothetical protein
MVLEYAVQAGSGHGNLHKGCFGKPHGTHTNSNGRRSLSTDARFICNRFASNPANLKPDSGYQFRHLSSV